MTVDLDSILFLLSSLMPSYPGIAPGNYAMELVRAAAFWVTTICGLALIATVSLDTVQGWWGKWRRG